LLEHLQALDTRWDGLELSLVVIDNDPQGSARTLVGEFTARSRFPILYEVEPTPGISAARNRCLERAAGADFTVFLDDDEFPAPGWLLELLAVQHRTQADLVVGPVIPLLPLDVPTWMVKGGFFERPRYPDGSPMKGVATNNLLLRNSFLQQSLIRFDNEMGLTGGEDTLFALLCAQAGATMVWADRALVFEQNDRSRFSGRWLLQRQFRWGNCYVKCLRKAGKSKARLAWQFCKALGWVIFGLAKLLPGLVFRGQAGLMDSACNVARGAGQIAAFFGFRYAEYGREPSCSIENSKCY
jgi:glycosyltransferase involved in cell wall biosynthesis